MTGAAPALPVVLLLHSSGNSARQWRGLADALAGSFDPVPVEFYGHGQRPAWAEDRRMALVDEAAHVVPLLERAGGAHVVGHSYGGAVALKLAELHPHLVRSVVAWEPVLFRLLIDDVGSLQHAKEVVHAASAMRKRLQDEDAQRSARTFVEFWSGSGAWERLSPAAQQSAAARMPSVMRHFDALFNDLFPRERMARLGIPMLLLSGSRTVPAARRVAHLLRTQLPLAEHAELPGMGHLGPITHPPAVNDRIRHFLNSLAKVR